MLKLLNKKNCLTVPPIGGGRDSAVPFPPADRAAARREVERWSKKGVRSLSLTAPPPSLRAKRSVEPRKRIENRGGFVGKD